MDSNKTAWVRLCKQVDMMCSSVHKLPGVGDDILMMRARPKGA